MLDRLKQTVNSVKVSTGRSGREKTKNRQERRDREAEKNAKKAGRTDYRQRDLRRREGKRENVKT
eukprot:3689884-Pleurochrysis_carterae.AAC.1